MLNEFPHSASAEKSWNRLETPEGAGAGGPLKWRPLKWRPPWKFGTPMVLPKFHPWVCIFILCGTITVQTKYHRWQVPRLEVMYFCRCYLYFHLTSSLFWPPPIQSRPIACICYQLCGHSRALSSWPLDPSDRQSSDRRRFTMLLLRYTLLDPLLPSIPYRVSHDTAVRD